MKSIFAFGMTGMAVVGLCMSSTVNAQLSGGKIVRVSDDPSITERCIDPARDRVWFTLRSLTTRKSQQWFTKDKDVSVIINAKVQTDPAPTTPISFPLSATAKFGDGPTGQVSVPIEYPIVSGLVLTQRTAQSTVVYSGLGAEITLINVRDRNALGSALQALDSITSSSKLPIPASPYTAAATYLIGFANSAVQKDIDAQKDADKAVAGAMQFNFDPAGECSAGDFERTGTKAIIYSDGNNQDPGYIDVQKISDYCFRADLYPAFVLKAAAKTSGLDCRAVNVTSFRPVSNSYIGFYLNKQTASRTLGAEPIAARDKQESLARCKANGVGAAQCLPEGSS